MGPVADPVRGFSRRQEPGDPEGRERRADLLPVARHGLCRSGRGAAVLLGSGRGTRRLHPGGHPVTRYGATILDAEGLRLTPDEKAFFREARPFGFILFARNIDTPDQVRALCAEMREAAGHAAPILIDQEGGRVQRMKGPIWRDWLPALEQVQTSGAQGAEAMYARYRIIAHELYALGIDTNCAPLVDVAGPQTHPFLKDRCYGDEHETAAALGRAVAEGLL